MAKFIIFINTCLVFFTSINLYASSINLTDRDMYVRQGFDKKWIVSIPVENDSNWQKFAANKNNRPVRVRQLKFKDLPKFKNFSLEKHDIKNFTYVTSFILDEKTINSGPLGLFLAQIGQNWEVYVNGHLLKSEVYIAKDGTIKIERAVRAEKIALNHNHLKTGINILAIKIIGNPVDDRTGLFMKSGYIIDKLENLESSWGYLLRFSLIVIYLFFGLYHLFLFAIRPKELYNFAYGFFSIVWSTYLFCRIEIIFSIFQNSLTIKIVELCSLALLAASFIMLVEILTRNRISKFAKIWLILSIIISATVSFTWRETLLRIIQISGAFVVLYGVIYAIVMPYCSEVIYDYRQLKRTRKHSMVSAFLLSIMRSFVYKIPGNLFLGVIVFLSLGVVDAINGHAGNPTMYSYFGFAFFILGIAGILSNRFVQVHNQMEELNLSLEQKVEERTEELLAANDEMAAMNQNLMDTQDELIAANEEMSALNESLVETRDQLWGEMQLARKVQTVLLPKNPVIQGYEILPYMKPADEVGGDYYDVINFEGYDWLIIGDVSGHGFPAGLIMMMVQTAIHATLERHPDDTPSVLLDVVNRVIKKNLQRLSEDKYMTITVFAVFENGKFCHSGLHQDILIYRQKTKQVEAIESAGLWIGLFDEIGPFLENNNLNVDIGDIVLLYTDGITEAWQKETVQDMRNPDSDMYGDENLIKYFKEKAEENSLEKIKSTILKSLDDYDYDDDITMVLLRRVK